MSGSDRATRTVVFPKATQAAAFVADLGRWDPDIVLVSHKGKTVVIDTPKTTSDGQSYLLDLAEFVGYHGSPPQGPVATIDGARTPRSY